MQVQKQNSHHRNKVSLGEERFGGVGEEFRRCSELSKGGRELRDRVKSPNPESRIGRKLRAGSCTVSPGGKAGARAVAARVWRLYCGSLRGSHGKHGGNPALRGRLEQTPIRKGRHLAGEMASVRGESGEARRTCVEESRGRLPPTKGGSWG